MSDSSAKPSRSFGASFAAFLSRTRGGAKEKEAAEAAARESAAAASCGIGAGEPPLTNPVTGTPWPPQPPLFSHGLPGSYTLLHSHEDQEVMRSMFLNAAPMACIILVLEVFLDVPFFLDVVLCVLWSTAISLQNEFSSRFATALRLGCGHFVANLAPMPRPAPGSVPPPRLYERHRSAECRVVREALSALALEVEIRPCPEPSPGVPSPWMEELADVVAAESATAAALSHTPRNAQASPRNGADGTAALSATSSPPSFASLPLPYLSSLPSLPIPLSLQGRGFALVPFLLSHFAQDPKDPSCAVLDLDEKVGRVLCELASRVRTHVAWGARAKRIDWDKLHRVRVEANRRQAEAVGSGTAAAAAGGSMSSPTRAALLRTNSTLPLVPENASSAPGSSRLLRPAQSSMSLRTALDVSAASGSAGASPSSPSSASSPLSPAGAASPTLSLPRISDVRDLQPLLLYGHESSASCRPVLELLSSLQLAHILRPCASGSPTRALLVMEYGSLFALPMLRDPNTGSRTYVGRAAVMQHIMDTYVDARDTQT